MKVSLKVKLVLSFLLLITVPISILGYLSYTMSSKALQSAIEHQLDEVAKLSSETITTSLEDIKGGLKIASQNAVLTSALTAGDDEKAIQNAFNYIKVFRQQILNVESVALVNKEGNAILTDASMTPNMSMADKKYFKDALGGRVVISDVALSKSSNKAVLVIAQPLTAFSQVIGVLTVEISFNNISKHAEEIVIGNNGYAYMIDKAGMIVSHPIKDKVLKENIKDIKSAELQVLAPEMLSLKSSQGFYTLDGQNKYARFLPAGEWILVLQADYNEYMKPAADIGRSTLLLGLVCISFAMLIAYFISNSNIVKPVKKLQQLMSKAGEGDLKVSANIKTKDEIADLARSFNQMIKNQGEIVAQVRTRAQELAASAEEMAASTEQINSATEQINLNIQEVAAGASYQGSSIIETSQMLSRLSSLVKLAQDKTDFANQNAIVTMNNADGGRTKVDETIKAIDIINSATQDTFEVLKTLDSLSYKIGDIVGTINSLAEQTNLLALNAAIEAARAGEHGKGFAVVADEVRKLSEQSNRGAQEIGVMVNEMIGQTKRAVNSINEEKRAVENGARIAEETDAAFVEIINAVKGIVKSITEVVAITNEEVNTSEQVVNLLSSVAAITEKTTGSSQEVASSVEEQASTIQTLATAAEEMSSMAAALEELTNKFRV